MKLKEPTDGIEIAVRIERHSVEMYMRLFEAVRSSRAREVFSTLAAEEERHLGSLRILLQATAGYTPQYRYAGEYELYVDGAAQRFIESFYGEDRAEAIVSSEAAIAMAMKFEQGKIDFYAGLAAQFDGDSLIQIESVSAEEESHLGHLRTLLQSYPTSGSQPGG